jgi:enediyne biosynthesis protein E4
VHNVGAPPSLFVNETRSPNHRVGFKLVGTKSNHAAIGARVTIHTPTMTQIAEVTGGGSYLSSNDLRLHFGLGAESSISRLEIEWPSGAKEKIQDVPGDAIYTIVEGTGIKETLPLRAPERSQAAEPTKIKSR